VHKTSHFLLVCMDAEDMHGRVVPAFQVASSRLTRARWPLYEGTRNRRHLVSGSRCLIYVGGKQEFRQSIVAVCTVASVEPQLQKCWTAEDHTAPGNRASHVVHFRSVEILRKPLPIVPLLARLSFVPANLQKWGAVLQGGCIRVSEADFCWLQGR
jgi:hypothetical protein